MAKAWVKDLWVKDKAHVPASQLRNIRTLAPEYQSAKYGKGKRWLVQWRGDDHKLKSESFDTKSDAESRQAELEDDQRSGRYVDPSAKKTKIDDVAKRWLDSKRGKASSRDTYGARNDAILDYWGGIQVGAITEHSINQWLIQIEEGFSPSYCGTLLKQFRSILQLAARERLIPTNPAQYVASPKAVDKPKGYLDVSEVEALAEAAGDYYTMIIFMAYTGLRIGEVIALRVGAVDLTAARVLVERTLTGDSDEGTPKGGKSRKVPLPTRLVSLLREQIADKTDDSYVFTTATGERLNKSNWTNRVFRRAVKGAGLDVEGLTPHSLRHTYASLCIAAGVDVVTLQSALGHANATETLNTYSHLWPEKLDDLAEALDKLL